MDNFTFVNDVLRLESPLWRAVAAVAVWAVPITAFFSVVGLVSVWLERKISAHMQCRLGPMEVGPHGVLQTLADGLKLLGKEDLVPKDADKLLFGLAPMVVFASVFVAFAVIPFSEDAIIADLDIGLFFLAAVGSLEAIGIVMAGWSSNNKWSLFGAVRAATQVVSYEIPLGLTLLTAVVIGGSLSMIDLVHAQAGGVWNWILFRNPFVWIAFIIYYISSLAECKRAPFDLPEAESELVSGFHTEYSGMRFAIFFLAEYGAMYVVSAIAAVVFLGGWYTGIPFLDTVDGLAGNLIGAGVIITKSFVLICIQMWIRWTLPRIRLDQMMDLCLKYLLPFSLAVLFLSTLWQGLWPLAVDPKTGKPDGMSFIGMALCVATVAACIALNRFAKRRLNRSLGNSTLPVFKVGY